MPFALFKRAAGHRPDPDTIARQLYEAAVMHSRAPGFYAALEVPDTIDGRFDMITLHVFLVLRRLRRVAPPETRGKAAAPRISQAVFDVFFADMDQSLREIGVGDMSVGKRVKAMARGFYGRIEAYDAGLADAQGNGLNEALKRNLYGTLDGGPSAESLARMAEYLRAAAGRADNQDDAAILSGEIAFPQVPDTGQPAPEAA